MLCHQFRPPPLRSSRRPGQAVMYLASARKRCGPRLSRNLPRPGVAVGDRAATEGILASRLGYTFLHYCPQLTDVPIGPRLIQRGGRLVPPFLFLRSEP